MKRGVLAVAGAAVLCGVCVYVLRGVLASGVPLTDIVLATCASAFLLALFSAALSLRAAQRARRAHAEMARLARSVESAISELTLRHARQEASRPGRDPNGPLEDTSAAAKLPPDNVVPLPAVRIV
jgi:hypothetical protein